MQELRQFIRHFSKEVSDKELENITSKFAIREISKEKFLLRSGTVCKEFSIIKKGCFRIFYLRDGFEYNSWFAFENTVTTEMLSFINQTPSVYSVQAIEDAEVFSISYKDLQDLYSSISNFQHFGLKLNEFIVARVISILAACQFETPENRYKSIMNDTNYTQRIPLKDLASFLGITPNSLSRLRKRMSNKQRHTISIPSNS